MVAAGAKDLQGWRRTTSPHCHRLKYFYFDKCIIFLQIKSELGKVESHLVRNLIHCAGLHHK